MTADIRSSCAHRAPLQVRNCHAQQTGLAADGFHLSILQRGRDQKEISRRKIAIGASDSAGDTEDDCELSTRSNFARRAEIPFLNLEEIIFGQQLASRLNKIRRGVVEVDGLQGFIDMQLARLSGIVGAVPIKHAMSGVTVLLDLDQQIAGANRMKSSGWQKHRVAGFDANLMNVVGDCSSSERVLEFLARHRLAQSNE